MAEEKCFCHLGEYKVKDADARKQIEDLNAEVAELKELAESLECEVTAEELDALEDRIEEIEQNGSGSHECEVTAEEFNNLEDRVNTLENSSSTDEVWVDKIASIEEYNIDKTYPVVSPDGIQYTSQNHYLDDNDRVLQEIPTYHVIPILPGDNIEFGVINNNIVKIKANVPTPEITISSDGFWVINGVTTNVQATVTHSYEHTIRISFSKLLVPDDLTGGINYNAPYGLAEFNIITPYEYTGNTGAYGIRDVLGVSSVKEAYNFLKNNQQYFNISKSNISIEDSSYGRRLMTSFYIDYTDANNYSLQYTYWENNLSISAGQSAYNSDGELMIMLGITITSRQIT